MKKFLVFGLFLLMSFAYVAHADDSEVTTQGAIQDFSDSHVTVNGMTFNLVGGTQYKHGTKADLAVGVTVKVEGHSSGGALIADKVEFNESDDDNGGDDNGNEILVTGVVSNVSGDNFTVNGTTFTVDDSTIFEHGTRGDLAPGRQVKVEGRDNNGTITAHEVEFTDADDDDGGDDNGGGEDDDDDEIEVRGLVTAVNGNSFEVAGNTFNVTAQTQFLRMSRDDLKIGANVEVTGDGTQATGYHARKVKREDGSSSSNGNNRGSNSEVDVLASVNEMGTELLELTLDDSSIMLVEKDSRVSGRHGLKSTASDLIPGLTVRLKFSKSGSMSEGERNEATQILVIGEDSLKGNFGGASVSSVLGSFSVNGKDFVYDHRTIVQGKTSVDDPANLPKGTPVVVLANPLDDGSYLANRIIVVDDNSGSGGGVLGRKVKFLGDVTGVAVNGSVPESFSVGGQVFLVNSQTRFRVKSYDGPFDLEQFGEGLNVRVIGIESNGDYIARTVLIYLPEFKFEGPLQSVGGGSLTIFGVQGLITSFTDFERITQGALAPGVDVEVKMLLWPDGSLIVSEVEPHVDDDAESELQGIITAKSVDGDNVILEIGGATVIVTPTTEIRDQNTDLTVDDLIIGSFVKAEGTFNNDGSMTARQIRRR